VLAGQLLTNLLDGATGFYTYDLSPLAAADWLQINVILMAYPNHGSHQEN
jgi:hypothetical protein